MDEWYDEKHGDKMDDIVGWVVWYTDGVRHTSLDTMPEKFPKKQVNCMVVWYFRSRGTMEKLDRLCLTRDEYRIPFTDIWLDGNWTDWATHMRIYEKAMQELWPPPGTE